MIDCSKIRDNIHISQFYSTYQVPTLEFEAKKELPPLNYNFKNVRERARAIV
jgi:hypothetical protein